MHWALCGRSGIAVTVRFPLLLLLTVVTGLVDAASYLKLGHCSSPT